MDYLTIDQLENMFYLIYSEEDIEDLQENKYYLAELFENNKYDYYFIKIIQVTSEKVYSSGCYVKNIDGWMIDQEQDYVNEMHKRCMGFIKFYSY